MKDFIRNLKNKQKCCHEYNDNGCDPKKCNYYFLCDDVPVFVHTFRILILITFLHSTVILLLTSNPDIVVQKHVDKQFLLIIREKKHRMFSGNCTDSSGQHTINCVLEILISLVVMKDWN